jgi:hypothetical protein
MAGTLGLALGWECSVSLRTGAELACTWHVTSTIDFRVLVGHDGGSMLMIRCSITMPHVLSVRLQDHAHMLLSRNARSASPGGIQLVSISDSGSRP